MVVIIEYYIRDLTRPVKLKTYGQGETVPTAIVSVLPTWSGGGIIVSARDYYLCHKSPTLVNVYIYM